MLSPSNPLAKYPRAKILLSACLFGIGTPYLTKLASDSYDTLVWLLDLASHWQWLFLAGVILFSAFLTVVDNCRWAVCCLVVPIPFISASPILPNQAAERVLAIASANVHLENSDATSLHDWLNLEKPDIAVILEISPAFGKQLNTINEYPYKIVQPDYGPFGIALLSKLSARNSAVVKDNEGIAHITAEIMLDNQPIRVMAFHPMPPISPEYHRVRDQKILSLVQNGTTGGVPALLVGDFNASPWSMAFAGLDALGWRRASALRPTWPAWGQGIFGIPIDHVLASNRWRLLESITGPAVGSDHYPILVRLSLIAG